MSIHDERLANGKLVLPSGVTLRGRNDRVVLRHNFFLRTSIAVDELVCLIRKNGEIGQPSPALHTKEENELELYYLFEESASGHWDNYVGRMLTCDGDKIVLHEERSSMEFYKGRSGSSSVRTSITAEMLVKLIENARK
jgi:hypothetical protein